MINKFIKKWITKIRNSNFVKSVLTLSAGVIMSQAIALLVTPIVSRIYSPEVLGDYTVITSNSTIIGAVICMGLMSSIMLPKDNDEAKGLCRLLTKLVTGGATILLAIALAISGVWKMFSVGVPYSIACGMLWASVVLGNIGTLCYGYVNRQKMYKVLFWNPSLGTVSCAIVRIVVGLLGGGLWGYMGGSLIANVVVIVHMLHYANPFRGKIGYKSRNLLYKYRDFPMVMLPSDLIGTVSAQLPVLLLGRFWGSFVLGSYSMCMTILKLPAKVLASPVNQVFYREATERINRGENIGEFAFSLVRANVKLALIPIFAVVLLGRPLFAIVLGQEWAEAGAIASIMSFYVLLTFCTSCLNGKFVIIGQKKTILTLNVFVLLSNAAVFCLGHLLNLSAMSVIMLFSVVGGLMSLIDLLVFMKKTNVSVVRFLMFAVQYLVLPLILGFVLQAPLQNVLLKLM